MYYFQNRAHAAALHKLNAKSRRDQRRNSAATPGYLHDPTELTLFHPLSPRARHNLHATAFPRGKGWIQADCGRLSDL